MTSVSATLVCLRLFSNTGKCLKFPLTVMPPALDGKQTWVTDSEASSRGLMGPERAAPVMAEKTGSSFNSGSPEAGTIGVNRRVNLEGRQSEHLHLKWVLTRGSTGRLAARSAC